MIINTGKRMRVETLGYVLASASQIENYLRCRRYWAWKYIDKVPSKPSEATEFGSHVHALCEKFCAARKEEVEEGEPCGM
jgi:hypothetical protein